MTKSERVELAMRAMFVGCSFCGAVDRPLRNTTLSDGEKGKICPECLRKEGVQIGHRKEDKKNG